MNYYEELDVSPSASTDEIKHAYKSLARLLHPDQCADENLKRLAQLQMVRLNQMLAVLTEPAARCQYDARLTLPPLAIRQKPGFPKGSTERPWRRHLVVALCAWILPATVVVLLLAILVNFEPEGLQSKTVVPAAAAPSQPVEPAAADRQLSKMLPDTSRKAHIEVRPLPVPLKSLSAPIETAGKVGPVMPDPPVLPVVRDQAVPEPIVIAAHAVPEPRIPLTPVRIDRLDPPTDHSALPGSKLAGHWYYVPADQAAPVPGVYLPEYIELHLSQAGGILRGHYTARYRVTDRAIEPNVAFEFEGAGNDTSAEFLWKGPGEATGNVNLRLVTPNRLEVTWVASRLSTELNLASGSAQLIRQRER